MKNIDLKSVIIGVTLILISGCSTEPEDVCGCGDNITDLDGNVYEIEQIGAQCWMAENLVVRHYLNGDEIPTGFSDSEWSNLENTGIGAYAVYDDDPANSIIYGNLYNWYAVDDARGVCPEGWHVPGDEEWMTLEMHLGMSESEVNSSDWRGTDEGSKLAGNADLWISGVLENNDVFGSSGFNALPNGDRYGDFGHYYYMGYYGYFWSSTAFSNSHAWIRSLHYDYSNIRRDSAEKQGGFSVRCVRD
ncbi:MAG: fibrobacter succinogenes major paralogous domain-containing protein [Candidatus Marinimicrobia bacterium]|nr:fibrobacter succinogenes major paralogous domain-containing protein [Candidatus Neomarinimicrobiota bacterium]